MFKKQYLIKSVTTFDAKSNSYAYVKGNKNYMKIDDDLVELEESPIEIASKQNYLYVWYSSVGKCEFYIDKKLYKTIEKDTNLLDITNNIYIELSVFNLKTFQSYRNLLNPITEDLILKEYIPYNLYVHNDKIFGYNNFKGELKRINTSTETLWEFPLSSLGASPYEPHTPDSINKILGVVHGNLWFTTNANRIIALEVETGKQVYKNEGFGVYLDEATQDIFSIASNIIMIIDSKALTIRETYNYLEADPDGIGKYERIYSPLLQGGYFTFLAEKPGDYGGIRHVGIFDYKARKLVWEYEVITEEECRTTRNYLVRPEPLHMSGDKLYIKDFKSNLHIFQREF